MMWLIALVMALGQMPIEPTPAVPIPGDPSVVQPIPPKQVKVVFPVVLTPAADPTPQPEPGTPFLLVPGRLYVVQSDKPFYLRAYPVGFVTIKPSTGPRDFYGVFADGSGKDEERGYNGKYLMIVKAISGKTGRITLVGFSAAETEEESITEVLIDIGVAPRPPPDDEPKPDDPKPEPKPDSTLKSLLQATLTPYSTLPATDKPKLAAAFRDAAKKIESGEITTMQQLTKVTADLMVEQVGLNALLPWIAWRDSLTQVLKTQNLTTPKDNLAAWKLIADVLEGK